MTDFHVKVGDSSTFSKTVGEFDVYSFAGISGDFAPNHVNKAYMEKSSYGALIAHGALLVGYMSTASTQMATVKVRVPREAIRHGKYKIRFVVEAQDDAHVAVDEKSVFIVNKSGEEDDDARHH